MNSPFDETELAGGPLDEVDQEILSALRAEYEAADPVPDGLVDRIRFEITLQALEAEVATLMQLDLAGAGVRSAATEAVRTITFTSESVTTMVTLTPQPDGSVQVDGWATPAPDVRVELLLPSGPLETRTDADGRFVFAEVPAGLAKFALHMPKGDAVATVLSPTIEL